jgi:hypothetical protein
MTSINQTAPPGNVCPGRSHPVLAARLKAIRAEISAVRAAPYGYGSAGPHRRQRDEYILQALAADIHARMCESRVA